MGTKADGRVQLGGLNAVQGMAFGLGIAAAEAAGEAAAIGGYRPTEAEAQRLSRALREAVLAMVALVDDWAAVSDEQLEGAARDLGALVVREVLGPPAPMALN
jgi:hypothetical protein